MAKALYINSRSEFHAGALGWRMYTQSLTDDKNITPFREFEPPPENVGRRFEGAR